VLEFPPDITPNAISQRIPPQHNVAAFQSESGQRTAINYGCTGHSAAFRLDFAALSALDDAKLLNWWMAIGGSSSGSAKSFLIPDCHPLWDLMPSFPAWREVFLVDDLNRHWWIVEDAYSLGGQLCFLLETSITVRNVYRRA
jgi:hypothetical protein